MMRCSVLRLALCQFRAFPGVDGAAASSSVVATGSRRHLTSKVLRKHVEKPAPFDYVNKTYGYIRCVYDQTFKRLDDSSKLIVVEGNIGTGKSKVAREIAKEFDFLYIPAPTMDLNFINEYGSDMRDYYDLVPERTRLFDTKMFYEDPYHINSAQFQYSMFQLKYECYQNALAHILNTGQGVVMDRSVLSDFVFMEAMYKKKCFSSEFAKFYNKGKELAIPVLSLWPHLIVYLDCPAEKCLENIHKRGIKHEVDSRIMDLEYLQSIEDKFKRKFLPDYDEHSSVLIYDWSTPGHTDTVVEDIENTDMGDVYDWHKGDRFETWHVMTERNMNLLRIEVTNKEFSAFTHIDPWNCYEMCYHPEDQEAFWEVMFDKHWGKYATGWNPEKDGWWNIMFSKFWYSPLRTKLWVPHQFADYHSESYGMSLDRYN